ncbi:amidohydrolase family protein [Glaciibacter psychrotolerans]|uniref:Imidazolonepropionase-like amidohydrolase n=1 Tax=Glaciibacter psychrotolerans TaxID=670054 RepID=A0A7Z0J7B5_9MICO|nr:amidohydrolase family protein [Leifsonia psychrotolerans]NYJ21305.1 imidazolonepropionase-like amidohydrolase [Leifsonia psychrotolerans]
MTHTVLPGFQDAHVHLALFDATALRSAGIARVVDLGGWLPDTGRPERIIDIDIEIDCAGQFLTAPGGYPSRQSWTPPSSVCAVSTPTDAAAAVDRQVAAGASVIKVTLNSLAGPVLSTDVLDAILARAHAHGLPVVAHTEGSGQATRAFAAGVDVLAHAPFSERLSDVELAAMAGSITWISTLDIHGWGEYGPEFERAVDNVRRFHARGGRVLYGTDLGNGPLPVGLNHREIEALMTAGFSADDVLRALTGRLAHAHGSVSTRPVAETGSVTLIPGSQPHDRRAFVDWLCTARAVTPAELEALR